ncbi:GtrA family protein [Paenibacillus sp. Soil522]|uniref:GtrA family protein n=1 Tax=Paenibacillus sp. Soil522 TaxID=1736388 RepID=UPI0006FD188D|nr:GtrA family protein [Paenibacillus sp. Soil522]KRE43277.1 hypothetical protein ASG81_16015 [Paenibacillus sp. Soil522]
MSKTVRKRLIAQFIAFNIVGLLNTAVDFLLFTLLIWLGTYYLLAQVIAYGAGMINSFVLNSRYTFGKGDRLTKRRQQLGISVRFIAWNGILLGITLLLLAVLTEWWRINEVIAKLIVTAVTVLLNFYGSRRWVFASGGSQKESS